MAKSRTDLINAALERLNAIARGAVPSAEDTAKMESIIDPMIADLHSRNIAWDIPSGSIPDGMFLHLVAILASHAKDDFGFEGGDYDRIKNAGEEGERRLYSVVRTIPRNPAKLKFERDLAPNARSRVGGTNLADA